MKKASVVIPLYHGIGYVNNLIDMFNRNYENLSNNHDMEIIFVKDSTEEFDESIFSNASTNLKITLLQNSRNYGIQYSRIKGIKNAGGDYIHMLDQDDEIADDFIENALNKIGTADVLVCNGKKQFINYNKILYRYRFMQWTVKHKWFYTKFSCRILSPGHCLIKKQSIPTVWMDNILSNSGVDDAFLWLLMLSKGCQFKIDRKIRYIHNDTGSNLSSDAQKMKLSLQEMLDICRKEKCLDKGSIHRMESNLNKNKKHYFTKIINRINKER